MFIEKLGHRFLIESNARYETVAKSRQKTNDLFLAFPLHQCLIKNQQQLVFVTCLHGLLYPLKPVILVLLYTLTFPGFFLFKVLSLTFFFKVENLPYFCFYTFFGFLRSNSFLFPQLPSVVKALFSVAFTVLFFFRFGLILKMPSV